jgi:hypothetical protein
MVIERFKEGAAPELYQRFREKGRMMPNGLEYISSRIDLDFKVCYQLMQTEDFALFDQWIANWRDLIDFEIGRFFVTWPSALNSQGSARPN